MEQMTLPDDPREALRRIASYIRCLDRSKARAVSEVEDADGDWKEILGTSRRGEVIGYYQLTPWLDGLLELADECDRIRAIPEVK